MSPFAIRFDISFLYQRYANGLPSGLNRIKAEIHPLNPRADNEIGAEHIHIHPTRLYESPFLCVSGADAWNIHLYLVISFINRLAACLCAISFLWLSKYIEVLS